MVFSSPEFLFFFLPLTLLAFVIAQRTMPIATRPILILASIVFYGWFDVTYIPLILGSIAFNYVLGQKLVTEKKQSLLAFGITANILLLGWFKYAGFFASAINQALELGIPVPHIVLPIAISFFTFQQIAYLVDSFQNRMKDTGLQDYALFVVFFPQLIAGPIVHHSHMISQYAALKTRRLATSAQVTTGLLLIATGLFKKVVIADTIAAWIDPAFMQVETLSMIDAWTAAIGYTLQLYFDFSGYCEMAMGLALLFGFTLPINFNSPYKSRNVSEFWKRWHITLGAFLRDYLYIPLGGSHKGPARLIIALMVTMLLGGLWHGAGWQFLLWGGLHGLFLVIFNIWRTTGIQLPKVIAVSITLMCVVFAWVPFRAETISDALMVWEAMFSPSAYEHLPLIAAIMSDVLSDSLTSVKSVFVGWELPVLLFGLMFCVQQRNIHERIEDLKVSIKPLLAYAAMACISIAIMGQPSTFIYTQF